MNVSLKFCVFQYTKHETYWNVAKVAAGGISRASATNQFQATEYGLGHCETNLHFADGWGHSINIGSSGRNENVSLQTKYRKTN
jgi:hypothetical protein